MSAALAGAVDLSALRARAEARDRAEAQAQEQARARANGEAPAAPVAVVDVTEATFQTEVLDRSFQVPVVLDLWAEWCGPCKQLSPVLERLATEGGGTWVLAKIDVDANQAIAQALRVQGIPAVKAVFQGQILGEFTGALPEAQVRQFIDAVVEATGPAAGAPDGPAAPGAPGAAPVAPPEPEDPRVVAAEDATAAGDFDAAARIYQDILAAEPAHARAAEALREVDLLRRITSAPPDAVARADAAPDDVDAQLAAADVELADGDVESAFSRLLDTVRRTTGSDREWARTRLVDLFGVVGTDDPRVATARRDLSRALY
ncbi:MAG TPA: tetratricopeptide repeat protein [Mycobacteriales bacterium]